MGDRFKFRCWIEDTLWTSLDLRKGYKFTGYVYFDIFQEIISTENLDDACEKLNCPKNLMVDSFKESIFEKKTYKKIEQCTGAKDMNGKLIYEGDILEDGGYIYVIKWDKFLHGFYGYDNNKTCFSLGNSLAKNSVIIGNIHENPELLNGGGNEA